jgi:hypothetical protein
MKMLGVGFRIQGARDEDVGYRVKDSGCRV